ncbi:hypothetical protein D3C72_288690 [compost metagenome]
MDDGCVMRFGESRVVMHKHHLIAGNVDQLVAFGLQRADVEEPVLRELVQRDQPLAIGLLGLAHGGMVVARLVVDVELLADRVDLFAGKDALGILDVPLADLAVDEQRRIGVALVVISRVQRTEAEFRLGDHHVARLDLVVEEIVELAHVEHRDGRGQLAGGDHVDAIGGGVHAVRAVGNRDITGVGGSRPTVDHRYAVHFLEVALGNGFLDPLDVEDDDPVLLLRHHLFERDALFGIVAGRKAVFALVIGIDIVEVAIDDHLPCNLHGLAVDRREDREIFGGLVEDLAVVRQRHTVLAVAEHIAGLRVFLNAQAMHGVLVRQFDDLIAFHDV